MARGRREIPPSCKNYGLPLYCAGWVPLDKISPSDPDDDAAAAKEDEGGGEPAPPLPAGPQLMVVLGGGGGEGRSGVPNALLLSHFDFPSRSLSDQPVHRLGTGSDVPYRMAIHPGGDGIVCSFPNSCRWFEWDLPKSGESHNLALKSSGRPLTHMENVGLQLAVAFNAEGSMLATGGEDGHLRVFKWPSMEIIIDQADAHATVKDLDFSSDAKFLVSLGDSGPCRVWDLISSTVVANLPRENGEKFSFCRFSQSTDNNQTLYVTAMHGDQGRVVCWNSLSWKRVGSKRIVRDPISAFGVSNDGKLFAIGTIEGDIVIVNSDMQVQTTVKKAHLGIVTSVVFSQDLRALVSASFDSSAQVTIIEGRKEHGLSLWFIVLVILLAVLGGGNEAGRVFSNINNICHPYMKGLAILSLRKQCAGMLVHTCEHNLSEVISVCISKNFE